jgi:hypothetical protein
VADVEARALACSCAACALLLASPGAGGGRWRAIPRRYLRDPAFVCTDQEWAALAIPVTLAFFLKSAARAWTAIYPSPAGPVESPLPVTPWEAIASRTPLAPLAEPDVEALLFDARPEGGRGCMLVPVDACYELVGHVRKEWRGLDGGDEARATVAAQFEALRARCEEAGRGAP